MEQLRIIIGDDRLDQAKQLTPFIPGAEIEYVSSPEELLARVAAGPFDIIVTDLQYSEGGLEGFDVLRALDGHPARKVLWTGLAGVADVRKLGEQLGAEVLDKDELGTLVGIAVSKTPLIQGGDILVYVPNNDMIKAALLKVAGLVGLVEHERVEWVNDLSLVGSGRYGLVIDLSQLRSGGAHGVVAHDLKYMQLSAVPRVVCLRHLSTVVADLIQVVSQHLERQD